MSVDMSFFRSSASVTFCAVSSLLRRCSAPVLSDVKYLRFMRVASVFLARPDPAARDTHAAHMS